MALNHMHCCCFLCCVLLMITLGTTQDAATYVTSYEEDYVILNCSSPPRSRIQAEWFRCNCTDEARRVTGKENYYPHHYHLLGIWDLALGHEGWYTCRTGLWRPALSYIYLSVHVKPKELLVKTDNAAFLSDSSVNFTCLADRNRPHPQQMYWTFTDDLSQTLEGATQISTLIDTNYHVYKEEVSIQLDIDETLKHHTLRCVLVPYNGTNITKDYELRQLRAVSNVTFHEGGSAILDCGDPPENLTQIIWYQCSCLDEDRRFASSQVSGPQTSIKPRFYISDTTINILHVENLKLEDENWYACETMPRSANTYAYLSVHVNPTALLVKMDNASFPRHSSVNFTCLADRNRPRPQQMYWSFTDDLSQTLEGATQSSTLVDTRYHVYKEELSIQLDVEVYKDHTLRCVLVTYNGTNITEDFELRQLIPTHQYTYPLLLRLPAATYDPDWEINILQHNYTEIFEIYKDLFSDLLSLHIVGLEPHISITAVRNGSVVIEATVFYTLEDKTQERILLLTGLTADRYNNPEYLHLQTAVWIQNAILRNTENILNGLYWNSVSNSTLASGVQSLSLELRSTALCPSRVTYDTSQTAHTWEVTSIGETAVSDHICLANGDSMATSLCDGNVTTGGIWREVEYNTSCPPLRKSAITDNLEQLSKMSTNASNATGVTKELVNLTSNTDDMTPVDIVYTSHILSTIANTPSTSIEVGEDIVTTVNNILALPEKKFAEAENLNQASTRILEALTRYAQSADLGTADQTVFVKPQVALFVNEVGDSTADHLGFGSFSRELTLNTVQELTSTSQLDSAQLDTAIFLSAEVISKAKQAKAVWEELVTSTTDPEMLGQLMSSKVRISCTVYQNHKLFISTNRNDGSDEDGEKDDGEDDGNMGARTYLSPNSRIIAGTVHGIPINDLQEPVKMFFTPLQAESSSMCGYWDTSAASGLGNWYTSGCKYDGKENGLHVCICDHLTNFAILTSVTQDVISEAHTTVLTIITITGLVLSICGLSFTVLTFLLFRKLRRSRAQKVLFNLALALLAVYIIFLVGIKQTDNEIICMSVAALLHYFILVAFAWMMVEAILQYLKFVKVFDTYVSGFIVKAAIPAWGLPAAAVGAVAGVDYRMFRGPDDYCWLSLTAFYYAFLIPVLCIILVNMVLFTLVIKGITCDRPKGMQSTQSKRELSLLQLRAGITCFILLGLTWVFGFLALNEESIIFKYIFCILNGMQGFFIFFFHNAQDRYVRKAWIQRCCCCQPCKHKYLMNESNSARQTGTESTSRSTQQQPCVYNNATFESA